jgi:hypothetical protein
MKRKSLAVFLTTGLSIAGVSAVANVPVPMPTPSSNLGIEVDVAPVTGKAGHFMVSSIITDLEKNEVVAKPRLLIASDKPARIEMGSEGKWKLSISVAADGAANRAAYDATYTRGGTVVSKQRVTVSLAS